MGELFVSTDFAVGYIKEIRFSCNAAQCIPRFYVCCVIIGVSGIGFIVYGNGAICTNRQTVNHLLEVGAVVLAVSLG